MFFEELSPQRTPRDTVNPDHPGAVVLTGHSQPPAMAPSPRATHLRLDPPPRGAPMHPILRAAVVAASVVVAPALRAQAPSSAAGPSSPAYTSQQRAQQVVRAALAAHGGEAKVRALASVGITYDGQRHMLW